MRWLPLVVLAACAPDDSLGETLWTRPASFASFGEVGPAGHLVTVAGLDVEMTTPAGTLAWRAPCGGVCGLGQTIDGEGNVFSATGGGAAQRLARLAAGDGSVAWSRSVVAPGALVALGDDGIVWWFVATTAPVDFGGGPVGPSQRGHVFGRFRASDGAYVSSGVLDYFVDATARPRALPGGGLVTLDTQARELVAIDAAGATSWRRGSSIFAFAVHDDGELTFLQFADGGYEIVRIDAQRIERWRRPGIGNAEALIAVPGSRAMVSGGQSLAGRPLPDAGFLALYAADGAFRREVLDAAIVVVHGAALDSYRLFELALSDSSDGGELVSRALP